MPHVRGGRQRLPKDFAEASGVCISGIDVTQAPNGADPTGISDSSSASNAAITAAGAAGTHATALTLLHQRTTARKELQSPF